ncbi:hypothetical protein Btru_050157 [Bulinus truncatus]|nr:hypothetical protein Btru_050157 [Bulinus truncatus]
MEGKLDRCVIGVRKNFREKVIMKLRCQKVEKLIYTNILLAVRRIQVTEFIPVDTFTLNHLPEGHRDNDLYELIKLTAELTVRVGNEMTSPHRPEFWPGTKVSYPFYNMRDKTKLKNRKWVVLNKYKKSQHVDKLIFIVSHPHGCSKQVSVGHWLDEYNVAFGFDRFTYTTCTCPGSSGAKVHCVGYEGDGVWGFYQYVHSGSLNSKLNYSGAGHVWDVTSMLLREETFRTERSTGHLYGLGCFKCSNVADPGLCTVTGQCAGDELCFIEKKLSGGLSEYYNMGCEKQQVCDAIGGSDVIIGKKRNVNTSPSADRTKRDVTLCNKCCNTDSCNLMICTDIGNPTDSIPASSDIYVRLVGGNNAYEGTVEVFFNGRWGSICDDHWTNNDAQVVCTMLGYQGSGAQAIGGGAFVPGRNSIWLTNVTCTGLEPSLYQCQHDQWGVTQCLSNHAAGIRCSSVTPEDDVIFLLDTGFGGMIFRMNLRTMSFTPIPLSQLYSPESFDYDPIRRRIYFVDSRLLKIMSMKFDSTDLRVVRQLDINSMVDKIQVDPLNRLIFFSDDGNNIIFSMNMDGSNLTQVISSNLDKPREIVLDPRSKTVYWSDCGAQPKIESANYDGSNRKTLVDTNIKWTNGLAVDYNTNKLYFVDGSLGTIQTITLQGTSRREIFKDAGARLLSIDVFDDYLYYTDWNRDTLMRIRKDGSGQTVVGPPSFRELSDVKVHKYGTDLAGVTTPSPVHFDPSHVYVRMGGQGDATTGRIEIFANGQWGTICDDHWDDNAAKVVCHMMGFSRDYAKATGQSSQGNSFGLISLDEVNCTGTEGHIVDCGVGPQNWAVHDCSHKDDAGVNCEPPEALNFQESNIDNFLIFCDVFTGLLIRMDLNTYSYTTIAPNKTPSPVAITFDPNDKMIYFSEVNAIRSEIRSSNHRGTDIRTIGNSTIMGGIVEGLAVDLLFYTDAGNKRIIAMSPDGTGLRIVVSNVDRPRALAVDKKAGVLYWTDWGTVPKIEKANYDGSNRQTIASSGLQYPNGLALDVTAGLLYFCDGGRQTIEVMKTDGSNRTVLYMENGSYFFGITLTSKYIFYSDWNKLGVMRLNRDGTNQTPVGPESFSRINGIYAYESTYTQ